MGRDMDRLSIISMNANGRNGKQFMDFRSNLDEIIGENRPDVMLLPGDENYRQSFSNYKIIKEQSRNETVLLYNCNRLRLKEQSSHQTFVIKEHFKQLVCPTFEVMTPPPTQTVVKEFHCLTWHFEAMLTTSDNRYKIGVDFMMFAQFLAAVSGNQILIGGDFNLPLSKMEEMLGEHNKLIDQGIEVVKPLFRKKGYMDEMTDNVVRPGRRLLQLRLVQCGNAATNEFNPDFYVASKEMELHGTKTLDVNSNSGKCVELQTKRPYIAPPMKTEMRIPARPPKHSGG